MASKKQIFKPHIVHHRHSFKLLPKHHTSYSLLAFMLLMTGLFSVGWTSFATGADNDSFTYTVNAKISGDPLTSAATFDSPNDQQRFTTQIITVQGSCPNDSYVSITRNGVYAGTSMCVNNRWSIKLSLVAGANVLQPQAFNRTDTAGPASQPRTVYYDQPVAEEPFSPGSQPGVPIHDNPSPLNNAIQPLVLFGQFKYRGAKVGDKLIQSFSITGGQAPYAISIDWGDGTNDVVSLATAGDFSVSHVYSAAGNQSFSSFIVKLEASDNQGTKATLQTMAIVTARNGMQVPKSDGIFGGGSIGDSAFDKFWRVVGPLYLLAIVALISFWLGEQRELELIRRSTIRKQPHRHA